MTGLNEAALNALPIGTVITWTSGADDFTMAAVKAPAGIVNGEMVDPAWVDANGGFYSVREIADGDAQVWRP